MAAATVSGDSAMSNNPASRPDPTRMHSFRAVNSEGENGASSRQDDRASAAPQTQHQPPAQGAARNSDTPPGSRPPDRRLYDAAPATSQSYSSSPPAKRKRIEEPASLVVRTSADSSDAPIVIKTSPETQAREVIHLLSPERTSPVALEASTSQYPGGRDSTSRTNEGSSWHSEQRRSETASSASRPPFNAYPNAQDGNQSSVHQIDDSSDEDDSDAPVGGRHSDGRRPKRQFSHRTKTGCFTCRRRKKKCDEGKPACQNCIKGKFQCWGYGNKPVGDMTTLRTTHPGIFPNTIRQPPEWPPPGRVPVNPDQPWHGPPHPPYMPEQQQNHYGAPPQQPPPPPNAYGPPQHDARDPWARPYNDAAHIHLQGNKLGPVDYAAPLNIREYQPKDQPPPPHRPQPPPDPYMPHLHRGPPPPPPPPPQYGHHFGGREGSHMSAGRRSSHLPPMVENERDKMLIGLPYRHWKDGKLIADRLDCKTAVDLYNRAALPSEALSQDERANRFTAILNPGKRISAHGDAASIGRIGRCGERTIVEAPFYCDYGYNLIIGSETVIYPNCFIQDPCEIIIGNRCIVGPNVKLYGMTASIDVKNRSGSQGNFLGGSIQIEDDCWIGGDVTILPYRIIGKGATVAAGSVVTRNVKPFTIVAGNPAKEVRSLDDSTIDRRMRTDIQQENEHMIEEMKRRRYLTGSEGPPGQQGRPM